MKKFYLGLDIGTNSVGLACTDENYNLLRTGGNDMLSVRLFDEASSATKRRTKRTARRRLMRRQQRIDFLQEIFSPYITDETFFIRLNNSAFHYEDKASQVKGKFTIFNDKGYTDKDFYKQFPTIFHLRRDLINGIPNADLRLYYMAIHHAVKYRGHFLWEGESSGTAIKLESLIESFNLVCEELFEDDVPVLDVNKCNDLKLLVLNSSLWLKDKTREVLSLYNSQSARFKEFITLILGGNAKPALLFGEEYKKEKSFSFKKLSDEEFSAMQEVYGDLYAVLEKARDVYNYFTFEKILNGNENISTAMVSIYETHAKDLKEFKAFIKDNYGIDTYKKIFKSTSEVNNYVNYIGYTKPQKKKINVKKCKSVDDFYKYIKGVLNSKTNVNQEELNYWLEKIENRTFLPKIVNADNGLFPYQINLAELDAILNNLAKNYPEFTVKDETGYSACEKIRKTFTFKIPYYVGPLNTNSPFSWVVRKPDKITPWNFDEVIDKPKTTQEFIRRMTNKCTHLIGKDVLPKFSAIYQRYNVLNQLNKLKINEQPISVELKQQMFNELFLVYPRVTDKKIKDFLVNNGKITKDEEKTVVLSGKDGDFTASMSTYITFKKILGEFVEDNPDFIEDVVLWHTLNTDKNIVENLILEKYGKHAIVREKIKTIKGLTSFKEFSSLSKEFLLELSGGINDVTGEVYTICGELWNTNKNLNEILYGDEYDFLNEINNINGYQSEQVTYKDLESLYVSPQVKRGIWQALQMVDECVDRVGKAPDKIFIEVNRGGGGKGVRTLSRKRKIEEIYKTAKVSQDLINELNRKTDADLRSERLYLYFLQRGLCAYTGKVINLEDLATDMYDVDHIFPRSITKDDSIDNKVLVLRTKNKEKLDKYPLPDGFTNQQPLWKSLHEQKLMSDKKYALLTRRNALDESDFNDFISRQIVVTNQTNKAVANLLKRKYEKYGTKIVFSKSSNVADFKQKFKIVKCRETNDFHHAHDAYLNVVVGNVYDTKFSSAHDYFHKVGDVWKEYSLKNLFHTNINGAWNENSLNVVLKNAIKTGVLVTRYSYVDKGEFYDETVYDKTNKGIDAPRKDTYPYNQTEKYGGYKSLKTSYFVIVNSQDKKGNIVKTIESVPVLIDYKLKQNPNALIEFLTEKRKLINPQIVRKLKKKTLLSIDGTQVYVAGATDDRILFHNATQWKTLPEIDNYVNALLKVSSWDADKKLSQEEVTQDEFIIKTNRFGDKNLVVNKQNNLNLYNQIIAQLSKPLYKGFTAGANVKKALEIHYNDFISLTTLNQVKVLLGCVAWLKCDSTLADLSRLKESATSGIIRNSKNITNKNVKIITYSHCGFKKRIINV